LLTLRPSVLPASSNQDPRTVFLADAFFATRSASFAPRLGAVVTAPPGSNQTAANVTNPFVGSLVPISSFSLPDPIPPTWNATVDMHACSAASGRRPRRGTSSAGGEENEPTPFRPHDRTALPMALALRGECSFAAKVRLAQALGARAVIVGDEALAGESEADQRRRQDLTTMFAPADESGDLLIPALFVSRATYLVLLDELAVSSSGAIAVRLEQDTEWENPLLDLLLGLLLLPSLLTVVTLGLHHLRTARLRRKERATPSAVEALEIRTWQADGWEKEDSLRSGNSSGGDGETDEDEGAPSGRQANPNSLRPPSADRQQEASGSGWRSLGPLRPAGPRPGDSADRLQHLLQSSTTRGDPSSSTMPASGPDRRHVSPADLRPRTFYNTSECAICLDPFKKGDQVRILPCGHLFHVDEVDQWLKGWKKVCPVCKADITKPQAARRKRRHTRPAAAPVSTVAADTTPLLAPVALADLEGGATPCASPPATSYGATEAGPSSAPAA
jgi:hypothetical protein